MINFTETDIKFKDDNLYHVFKQRFADDINCEHKRVQRYATTCQAAASD